MTNVIRYNFSCFESGLPHSNPAIYLLNLRLPEKNLMQNTFSTPLELDGGWIK